VKFFRVTFLICVALNGSVFAQPTDPFQPDIPAPLVSKVDDANKKVESGHYAEAVEELQDVLKQRPDYYRALVNLGLVYQDEGIYGEAIQTLEKAKNLRDSLHISDSSILNSIGWAYMSMNRFNEAEKYFQEALKEGHENPSETERVLNNLGYLYLQKGDTAKARVYLQKAINDYHSTGAQKVLRMTEQYDRKRLSELITAGHDIKFGHWVPGHHYVGDIGSAQMYLRDCAGFLDQINHPAAGQVHVWATQGNICALADAINSTVSQILEPLVQGKIVPQLTLQHTHDGGCP